MILGILTSIHLLFSLVSIGVGVQVLFSLLAGKLNEKSTVIFLRCALVASVTGLFFPLPPLLSTHWVAMVSVYASGAAFLGWCKFYMSNTWRAICAFSLTIVLGLNILFVLTQAFTDVPAWDGFASTQPDPALLISQLAVLVLFAALGVVAARRLRDGPVRSF